MVIVPGDPKDNQEGRQHFGHVEREAQRSQCLVWITEKGSGLRIQS